MDFNLTEEHLMIQQAARDFAQNELLPGVIERDEHSKFPTEQVKMMGELGFLGMMVDPKYGGAGLDSVSYVLAMTEIAKVDASAVAENVAKDYPTAKITFEKWVASSGHRKNIEGDFTHTAVSVKKDAAGHYYFTQLFYR